MSTLWLRQHVEALQHEVHDLEARLEELEEQAAAYRDQLGWSDAELAAADRDDARRAAFSDLERYRNALASLLPERDAVSARLDWTRIELAKALLDLDASAFVQRHNADPEQAHETDPVEATGQALQATTALVDAEAVKPPDAPASTHLLATFRRRPRTAAAIGVTATLAAGWAAVQTATAPSLLTSTVAATHATSTTPATHLAGRLALPAGSAAAPLRPAVLVAAAALAKTPDHARAAALADHLDDLPHDLTQGERDALLGPTTGVHRAACLSTLQHFYP
ncbi:MAG: hypothetical protein AAGB29_09945 [Planctomycetota bacterium]